MTTEDQAAAYEALRNPQPMIQGWPAWQVMLAEVVVGMHDGRLAIGRRPSRNVAMIIAALPPELLAVAREQNATRAARDEAPANGPRMVSSVPEVDGQPSGYVGATRRKRQATADHAAHLAAKGPSQ